MIKKTLKNVAGTILLFALARLVSEWIPGVNAFLILFLAMIIGEILHPILAKYMDKSKVLESIDSKGFKMLIYQDHEYEDWVYIHLNYEVNIFLQKIMNIRGVITARTIDDYCLNVKIGKAFDRGFVLLCIKDAVIDIAKGKTGGIVRPKPGTPVSRPMQTL